jgi:hypothetical protein
MPDDHQLLSTTTGAVDPVEQIAQHLLRNPSDLVDARHLMRHFHASAADFQRALQRLEQLTLHQEEKAAR